MSRLIADTDCQDIADTTGAAAQVAAKPSAEALEQLAASGGRPELLGVEWDVVETCTLPRFAGLGPVWRGSVATVVEAAPEPAAPWSRLRIEQRTGPWLVTDAMYDYYGAEEAFKLQETPAFQGAFQSESNPIPEVPKTGLLEIDDRFPPNHELGLAAFAARRLVGIPDFQVARHTWTGTGSGDAP